MPVTMYSGGCSGHGGQFWAFSARPDLWAAGSRVSTGYHPPTSIWAWYNDFRSRALTGVGIAQANGLDVPGAAEAAILAGRIHVGVSPEDWPASYTWTEATQAAAGSADVDFP